MNIQATFRSLLPPEVIHMSRSEERRADPDRLSVPRPTLLASVAAYGALGGRRS
jgi:hypothetical protein